MGVIRLTVRKTIPVLSVAKMLLEVSVAGGISRGGGDESEGSFA